MKRRRRLLRGLLSAVAIAAVMAAAGAAGTRIGAFAGFQERSTDSFFPSARRHPAVVVVAMDERSLIEFGAPPWPRSVQAAIARRLAAAGAAVVVWDVTFYLEPTNDDERAQTADFAAALRELDDAGVKTVLGVDGKLQRKPGSRLLVLDPAFPPTPELQQVATAGGHVKVDTADADGVVRRVPLVVQTRGGGLVPSLSLAAVLAYRNAQVQPVVGPRGVQAGGRFAPTEGDTQLRLNFARGLENAPGSRALVSAVDVVRGITDPRRFTGKIVLIGATAESMRDNFDIPVDKSGGMPGVFIHANAVNTMLTSSYLEVVGDTETVVLVAVMALVVALAVLFLPLWLSAILSAPIASSYLVLAMARFDSGHLMNLVYPFGAIACSFVIALMIRYFTETRHRQRVSRLFSQYVPETVARRLVEEGRLDEITEGERLDVSLFFCDLRGFTALSATLTPQQVRAMLNEFYDVLTRIILEHRGTVVKFVGDEVFAVFGAPLPVEHHPQVALECALAIQRAAPTLSERLAGLGIPPVQFGIGMNSGEVVAAHVGGGRRRQYDVVGDTVNLGSRMCGQAGKGDIVMTADTYRRLDAPPPAESMGLVALKGVEVPLELYRIHVEAQGEPGPEIGSPAPTAAGPGATMSR